MKLTIDAKSAKLGGAVTYLRSLLPELRARLGGDEHQVVVVRPPSKSGAPPWPEGFEYRDFGLAGDVRGTWSVDGMIGRMWFDQVALPRMLREDRTDVLFASANFGTLRSPCRQVLLVRNSLYFDELFLRRIRSIKMKALLTLQRRLILRNMVAANIVLFPTRAMLDIVARWTDGPRPHWRVSHFGIRHELFTPSAESPRDTNQALRLLHVSHYSDQKNLAVLLEAMERLEASDTGRFRLRTTAGFTRDSLGESPYCPQFKSDQDVYRRLNAAGVVEDVEWMDYGNIPELYRSSDVFLFPSYTESFGHPLVEAMTSGLPVVAADVPTNREICGEAALYFSPFSAEDCADMIRRVGSDDALRSRMSADGLARAQAFDWRNHASDLVDAFKGN